MPDMMYKGVKRITPYKDSAAYLKRTGKTKELIYKELKRLKESGRKQKQKKRK